MRLYTKSFALAEATATAAVLIPVPQRSAETELWNAAERSDESADFAAYLKKFPRGKYAALARIRLKARQPDPFFCELPMMLVNINDGSRNSAFLKILLVLELEIKEDGSVVERSLAHVTNASQVYLRGMTLDDVTRSGSLAKLRTDLLFIISRQLPTVPIVNLLFTEILLQ